MPDLPTDLKYAKTHEWAKLEANNVVRVGITDFAQEQLGDLVYIDLPNPGDKLQAQQTCAVVESVKTASDLHSPVDGTVIAVNDKVLEENYLVNDEPYQAWLFCLQADDVAQLNHLMDAEGYLAMING